MFYTPEEKGINQEEINAICERLWKERIDDTTQKCHDCGVDPSEAHEHGCDVARCSLCGTQLLSCDCEDGEPDVWTGIWPGIKECYEKKLICFDTCMGRDEWRFDLNTLARL